MRELEFNESEKYKEYIGKSLFVLSLFLLGLMIFLIVQKPFLHIDEWFTRGLMYISFKEMVHVTAIDVHPPLYYAIALIPVYLFNKMDLIEDKEYLNEYIDNEENSIFISAIEGEGIDLINKKIDTIKKIDRTPQEEDDEYY